MSTPYWGSMEAPVKVARRNSVRRSTGSSKDVDILRSSVSTMDSNSQIASPAGSYFPDALAPRPSSGQPKKRRPRDSLDREKPYALSQYSPAPAVPDVPHAPPPLSYKSPYSKEQTASQNPTRSRSTRRNEPIEARSGKEAAVGSNEIRLPNRTSEKRVATKDDPKETTFSRRSHTVSRSDWPSDHNDTDNVDPRREAPTASRLVHKISSATDRREGWAADRSPLQRLELALDSLTKEEKRARAEEAELLAKVIPKRTTSLAKETPVISKPIKATRSEAKPVREAAGSYRSASMKQKADLQQPREEEQYRPNQGTSFRERAALAFGSGATAGATVAEGGSLSRSLSKRIKKEPPGDPWYNRRKDAETTYRDVKLKGRGGPEDDYMEDELPVRKRSPRKFEQLTGKGTSASSKNEASTRFNGIDFAPKRVAEKRAAGELRGVDSPQHHHASDFLPGYHAREKYKPGRGLYLKKEPLKEWKQGSTAFLSSAYLDLDAKQTEVEKNKAWWEAGDSSKLRNKPLKSRLDRDDGEGDNVPTSFKPALYLKCGPLLRYKGIRREPETSQAARRKGVTEREIWKGSVLIVTTDEYSDYVTPPTLRIFSQPADLSPPPPSHVDGAADDLPAEYVDPIVGLPKIARDGSTLICRPVEELDFGVDLSRNETDSGLFEQQKSANLQKGGFDGSKDPKTSRRSKKLDGENVGKYLEVFAVKLDVEKDVTFWRFNIEVELASHPQRIAYRINRGPSTAFWVPGRGEAMNIMFYSCNGFTLDTDPDSLSGPDPLWRDVLNSHQTRPFHCMIGGGDQIYSDPVTKETELFKDWSELKNPITKHNAPCTPQMQFELETFYLNNYCMWFSQGLFGLAASQIPMINIFDDHDIIDGFGSYPDSLMGSPVFMGLGAVAYRFYLLFQHHTIIDEGEESESSWIVGPEPGPWIGEHSRSLYLSLGRPIAFLGLDCRTERRRDEILSRETYDMVFDRCRRDIRSGETKHLIVLLGVPIAYPRLVWLENLLTSRLLDPIKAAGRMGLFKDFINDFDGGVEILDDLDDHWCAKNHKVERAWLIEELQKLAAEKSVRITILGGDVHLGAIGRFYSNPALRIPKDQDFRYMGNIISSAIVNEPPPEMMADLLNKRNKVHHLNRDTDESMVPIFTHDVDNKPRNNKCLLPRRNWCSIAVYVPGNSPPPTPPAAYDGSDRETPSPQVNDSPGNRRDPRGPSYTPEAGSKQTSRQAKSRPPLSSGILRRLSTSRGRKSVDGDRGSVIRRTLSLSRKDFTPKLFRKDSSKRRPPNDGGINGYGAESEETLPPNDSQTSITNSGYFSHSGNHETTRSDGNIHSSYLQQAQQPAVVHQRGGAGGDEEPPRPGFRRTPTDLARKGVDQSINLEGGLEITLNVEREQGDPAGITVPYKFIVPALWYEAGRGGRHSRRPSALERLRSFGKGRGAQLDR